MLGGEGGLRMGRVDAAASEWDGALVGRGWVLGGWGGNRGRAQTLSYLEPRR